MSQSKDSQAVYQNTKTAASASAVDAAMSDCAQLHWVPAGMLRRGDQFVDVSCHGIVRITLQTPRLKWRNDTFFFCSTFCRERFARAPDEILTAHDVCNDSICN